MELQVGEIYNGFRLIEERKIDELSSKARRFEHVKSGMQLMQLLNKEKQKTFTISFKTPARDNSGTAHIIEHAVCCASKKYPLKDTFMELEKGSLCTALNACTYQDMTMYYCASTNEKDLSNLIAVYMDLVFNPLLKTEPQLFRQEGWHYAIKNKKEAVTYKGIVYHEMLGEYDDPLTILEHAICETLFPDTPYQFDAGGVPEAIVQLDYKKCLDYYNEYYHPSNACICIYGDSDILKHLTFLNSQYLQGFDKKSVKADLPLQQALNHTAVCHKAYPSDGKEDHKAGAYLALSFVVGTAKDSELRLAFEILEQILLKSAASPLVEVLIVNKELGKGLMEDGYNPYKQQPTFTIALKGTSVDKREEFEREVFTLLRKMITEGIDAKLIEASLSIVEFGLKEADDSFEPKGVFYSEKILNGYLYGGDAFCHLSYESTLNQIKSKAYNGYFEGLIERFFLQNSHRTSVVIQPSKVFGKQQHAKRLKQLKHYKKQLTKENLEELIKMNRQLDAMQKRTNSQKDLEVLPVLALSDIPPKTETVRVNECLIEGVKILFNPESANGITYIHLLFDASAVKEEDIPYIGLLVNLLSYLGTQKYTYQEIDHNINTHIGGLGCQVNAYSDVNEPDSFKPIFKISAKLLDDKLPEFVLLMSDILNETIFTEKFKLKEILGSVKYELERNFNNNPEYVAMKRIYTYISQAGNYEDLTAGMSFYNFLSTLYSQFDNRYETLVHKLKDVSGRIFNRNHLLIGVTTEESQFERVGLSLRELICSFKSQSYRQQPYTFTKVVKNEGYIINSSLYAVARGFNYKKAGYAFHGTLQVISHILESTYLWDTVRLGGGAYGCDIVLGADGNMVICSYSDPHLKETLEVYRCIGDFLRNFHLSQSELHKYIIGTIGKWDSPLSMEQKSERIFTAYLCGITQELLQKTRQEILEVTPEAIRQSAALFDAFAAQDIWCVIGNSTQIKKHHRLFKTVSHLSF